MNLIESIIASARGPAKASTGHTADPPEPSLHELEQTQPEPEAPERPVPTDRHEHSESSYRATTYSYEQPPKQLSLEQLEEILRRMNLSFDLFEIQRIFVVDPTGKDEPRIEIRNTVTGELIRTIPFNEVSDLYQEFKQSVGSIINKFL